MLYKNVSDKARPAVVHMVKKMVAPGDTVNMNAADIKHAGYNMRYFEPVAVAEKMEAAKKEEPVEQVESTVDSQKSADVEREEGEKEQVDAEPEPEPNEPTEGHPEPGPEPDGAEADEQTTPAEDVPAEDTEQSSDESASEDEEEEEQQ